MTENLIFACLLVKVVLICGAGISPCHLLPPTWDAAECRLWTQGVPVSHHREYITSSQVIQKMFLLSIHKSPTNAESEISRSPTSISNSHRWLGRGVFFTMWQRQRSTAVRLTQLRKRRGMHLWRRNYLSQNNHHTLPGGHQETLGSSAVVFFEIKTSTVTKALDFRRELSLLQISSSLPRSASEGKWLALCAKSSQMWCLPFSVFGKVAAGFEEPASHSPCLHRKAYTVYTGVTLSACMWSNTALIW